MTIGAPGTGLFWWTRLPPHAPSASGRRWALAILVAVMALAALLLLGSIIAASAAACGDGSFGHAHRGACAYHHGYERHGRYWDGPLSDEGTRYYGESGGTVHYGY